MSLSEKPQSQSLLLALTDLVLFHPPETIWIRAFQCGSLRFFLDVFTGLEVQLPETRHLRTAMTEKSQNKLPVGPLGLYFESVTFSFSNCLLNIIQNLSSTLSERIQWLGGRGYNSRTVFLIGAASQPFYCHGAAYFGCSMLSISAALGISKINVPAPPNPPQVHIFRRFIIDTSCWILSKCLLFFLPDFVVSFGIPSFPIKRDCSTLSPLSENNCWTGRFRGRPPTETKFQ